jgi:predicted small lipoprotein YifL
MRLLGGLALLGGITLAMTACGKRGALVYPDMLVPAAPTAASAIQSGSGVKIQFDAPTSDRAGNRLNNLAGLKISKSESDSAPEQTCRSCMNDYRLFRKLYLDLLPNGVQRFGNRLVVLDGDVSAGWRYSYVVVPFTKDGVDGVSSAPLVVQVVKAVPAPILHAESCPTEIKLTFSGLLPVEGDLAGYNLYRAPQNDPFPHRPINKEPLGGKEYIDSGLARGVVYHYLARAAVRLPSGVVVESLVSNEVQGMLKDDE